MPNTIKLLEQSDASFKRYTGIYKATFGQMLDAMQEHKASKTKSGHPSELSLETQIILATNLLERIPNPLSYWYGL